MSQDTQAQTDGKRRAGPSTGMARPGARLVALALLIASLFGVTRMNRASAGGSGGLVAGDPDIQQVALEQHGFRFEEVAAEVGIELQHSAPRLDPVLEPIMPLVASMGAGVSIADVDGDGWQDIYAVTSVQGGQNALYRNQGDGSFRDIAAELGLADVNQPGTGVSMGSIWGDVDGNGLEDLLLYKWGRPELFLNRDGESFERVTEDAGLPEWMNANSAVWLDFDRDGLVDLFLGGYYPEEIDLWHLDTTKIMPESYEYAENGGRNHLLRNLGGGRFEDVTDAMGLHGTRWTLAASAADLRGVGYPDLLIANDYGVPEYWLNEDGEGFREVGRDIGIAGQPKSGMNLALGDVFNDGRRAVFITNISASGQLVQGNNLWVPLARAEDQDDAQEPDRFANMAEGAGVALGGWAFGAQFGDLNNDGALDLFQTNGYVSADPDRSYWYDMSKVAIGNERVIGDAKNWPAVEGRSLSGHEPKHVWINDGLAQFRDVAAAVGVAERHDGRAVALADLWNRGALDVVVAHQNGPLLLYRNQVAPGRSWIGFDLRGAAPNTSAIGASVHLYRDGRQQVRDVTGGEGFSSQNQRRLHFGLGESGTVERAEIVWPSGRTTTLKAPKPGRYHAVDEGDVTPASVGDGGAP